MAETYPENRQLAAQRAHQFDHTLHILRVARPVGEEQTVWLQCQHLLRRGIIGHNGHIAAAFVQAADDVVLDAAVDGDHGVFMIGGACLPPLFAADDADRVMRHRGCGNGGKRRFAGGVRRGENHAARAEIPYAAGQLSRIDAPNAGNLILLHHFGERLGIAEVARTVAVFPHDHAADGRRARFIVFVGNAVVADQRIRHDHRLIGVGGVGQDLLIAHHGCVEHNFAYAVRACAERVAVVFAAVL